MANTTERPHKLDFRVGDTYQLWCSCNAKKTGKEHVHCVWLLIPEWRARALLNLLQHDLLEGRAKEEVESYVWEAA